MPKLEKHQQGSTIKQQSDPVRAIMDEVRRAMEADSSIQLARAWQSIQQRLVVLRNRMKFEVNAETAQATVKGANSRLVVDGENLVNSLFTSYEAAFRVLNLHCQQQAGLPEDESGREIHNIDQEGATWLLDSHWKELYGITIETLKPMPDVSSVMRALNGKELIQCGGLLWNSWFELAFELAKEQIYAPSMYCFRLNYGDFRRRFDEKPRPAIPRLSFDEALGFARWAMRSLTDLLNLGQELELEQAQNAKDTVRNLKTIGSPSDADMPRVGVYKGRKVTTWRPMSVPEFNELQRIAKTLTGAAHDVLECMLDTPRGCSVVELADRAGWHSVSKTSDEEVRQVFRRINSRLKLIRLCAYNKQPIFGLKKTTSSSKSKKTT